MKSEQIGRIVHKVEELKALFIFGQSVMPFLEDLFYFVQEIAPLLEEINLSLQESSLKMPKASNQLNKVSEATEVATTEILDMVDAIGFKLNGIQTNINRFKSYNDLQDDLSKKIKRRLNLLEQKYPEDDDIKSTKELWEKVDQSEHLSDPIKNSLTHLNEIRQLSGNIMLSLQVQDITAQQIASVNHLIESVQQKLDNLLETMTGDGKAQTEPRTPKIKSRVQVFDSAAEYTKSGARQHIADEVMLAKSEDETIIKEEEVVEEAPKVVINEPTSQDDIDALFK